MPLIRFDFLPFFFLISGFVAVVAAQDELPRSTDARLKVELFAESPQIVTPTGIDIDHEGRVWVIESNTHFPPEGYQGHSTDRVLVMLDADKDGKADKITVFKDGLTHTMSIAVKPVWLDAGQTPEKVDKAAKVSPAVTNPSSLEVFIATRREILLCTDRDGDLKCDDVKQLVQLETSGNYPHNGLAGFAFDALGNMFFGFGENLGADYTLIGSDGTTLSGGGEGGNIYRCRPDGSKLERWATGFWNPHASCIDAFGRLFTLDNDPDSRPPCRLLHIIPGGDYGYRFRNGRKGTHPFTSWNGEIPGTLPMVSGTGEAPSGIVCYESDGFPKDYLGTLLVGSWGDHRIDKFVLKPRGVSFESMPQPVIKGGENFRPVGLALAPDGSLFVTDWVSKEYKLHGLGRIWRISTKEYRSPNAPTIASVEVPSPKQLIAALEDPRIPIRRHAARQIAASEACLRELNLSRNDNPAELETRHEEPRKIHQISLRARYELVCAGAAVDGVVSRSGPFGVERQAPAYRDPADAAYLRLLDDADPFVFSVLIEGATQESDLAFSLSRAERNWDGEVASEGMRLLTVLAARRRSPQPLGFVQLGLNDISPRVRRAAVQWAAEEKLIEFRPAIEKVLASEPMTTDLFLACLASLSMLDGVPPAEFEKNPPAEYILAMVKDSGRPAALRATALRMLSPSQKELDAELLGEMLSSPDEIVRRESVRTLQHSPIPERDKLLRGIAADESLDMNLRADAVAGLAGNDHHAKLDDASRDLLIKLAQSEKDLTLRLEAIRSLRGSMIAMRDQPTRDATVKDALKQLAASVSQAPEATRKILSDALSFAIGPRHVSSADQLLAEFAATDDENSATSNLPPNGNPAESGRRTFFHMNGAGCYKCHLIGGRGGQVGPDLTVIARTMDRKKLAESILEPNKEISPQFTTWAVETTNGKVLTGMLLGEEVNGDLRLGNNLGEVFFVPFNEIETRTPLKTSIMPEKLHETMTAAEFRDLIAYLETLK